MKHYDKSSWFKKNNKTAESFYNGQVVYIPNDLVNNESARESFINRFNNWKKPTKNVILLIKPPFPSLETLNKMAFYRLSIIETVLSLGIPDNFKTRKQLPKNLFLTDTESVENYQLKKPTLTKMNLFSESDFHLKSYIDQDFFKYALQQIALSDVSILEVSHLFHPFIKELLKEMNVITIMFKCDVNYTIQHPTDDFNANRLLEMLLIDDLKLERKRFYFFLPNAETRKQNLIALQNKKIEFMKTSCESFSDENTHLLMGDFFVKKHQPFLLVNFNEKHPHIAIS